jgi:hypothetical protein
MVNGVMKSAPAGTLDAWSPPADAADGDNDDVLAAILLNFVDNVEDVDFDNDDENDDDDAADVDDADDDDDDNGDNW